MQSKTPTSGTCSSSVITPIHSLGNYGGYFSFGDYFKPFPIIGLFRTAFHANVGNQYDLANERLTVFMEEMNNLLYFHDNLIYASGHERNQQIINFRNNFLINSGAAEKGGYATEDEQTLFASKSAGIIRIDYFEDGKVETQFLKNESGQFSPSGNHLLFIPPVEPLRKVQPELRIQLTFLVKKQSSNPPKWSGNIPALLP